MFVSRYLQDVSLANRGLVANRDTKAPVSIGDLAGKIPLTLQPPAAPVARLALSNSPGCARPRARSFFRCFVLPPMSEPSAKRSRRHSAQRTTIQGLLGHLEHDVQMQQAFMQAGVDRSISNLTRAAPGAATWNGPQGEWVGPVPGFVPPTAPVPGAPATGATSAPHSALDFLAGAAVGGQPPVPTPVPMAPPGVPTAAVAPLAEPLRWIGGAPPVMVSDHFSSAAVVPPDQATVGPHPPELSAAPVAPLLAPVPTTGAPMMGITTVGCRGVLHRPCSNCRTAKVLCDRQLPCTRCCRLGVPDSCAPPPTVQRGRPSHHSRLLALRKLTQQEGGDEPAEETVDDDSAALPLAPAAPDGPAGQPQPPSGAVGEPSQVPGGAATSATGAAVASMETADAASEPPKKAGGEAETAELESKLDALRRQIIALGVQPCI